MLTGSGNGNINNGGYPLVAFRRVLSGSGPEAELLSGGGASRTHRQQHFYGAGPRSSAGTLKVRSTRRHWGCRANGLTIGGGTLLDACMARVSWSRHYVGRRRRYQQPLGHRRLYSQPRQ